MEEYVYTTGSVRITIKATESEHKSGHKHRHRRGEDLRTHHTQQHHGTYSQNPIPREYAHGQGYPKLTAENLSAHERLESSDHIPQAYRRQEDDTAAQCGQRYPEEHRRRRQHFDDSAHGQHNLPTHHAAHHGYAQESGRYETGFGYAAEGGRSGGGYANQPHEQPQFQGVSYGEEYQRQHAHHAAYYQSDRQELGQGRFGSNYSHRDDGSTSRRAGGSSHSRDAPEWVLYREGLANVEEGSEGSSIQCEIEEVE